MVLPGQPAVLSVPPVPPVIPGAVPPLYWSYFKPKFAGKPDEDTEVQLLRTNDKKDMHVFPEGVKVWGFCLTLVGYGMNLSDQ